MRSPNTLALSGVSKRTSMLRPSTATKEIPLASEPVSIALTPVLSLIKLMARATASRVACGLFNTVVMLAEA